MYILAPSVTTCLICQSDCQFNAMRKNNEDITEFKFR